MLISVGATIPWRDLPSGTIAYCRTEDRCVLRLDDHGFWFSSKNAGAAPGWAYNASEAWSWMDPKNSGDRPWRPLHVVATKVTASCAAAHAWVAAAIATGMIAKPPTPALYSRHVDAVLLERARLESRAIHSWSTIGSNWIGYTSTKNGVARRDVLSLSQVITEARLCGQIPVNVGDVVPWSDVPSRAMCRNQMGHIFVRTKTTTCDKGDILYSAEFDSWYHESRLLSQASWFECTRVQTPVTIVALSFPPAATDDEPQLETVVRAFYERAQRGGGDVKVGDEVALEDVPHRAMVKVGEVVLMRTNDKADFVRSQTSGWMHEYSPASRWPWKYVVEGREYAAELKGAKRGTIVALDVPDGTHDASTLRNFCDPRWR